MRARFVRSSFLTRTPALSQVHTIYANLDKGVLAKSEDLIESFGTDDEDAVCVEILNRGDFQVSEQERQMQLDALFKDVATRVTDMCVHPETKRPYPLSTIERAMRDELHFAPALSRTAKQQALAVVKQLEGSAVLPIARARMHLRLRVPSERLDEVQSALKALQLDETPRGEAAAAPAPAPPAPAAPAASDSLKLSIGAVEVGGGMASVTCVAEPWFFRGLSEIAKEMGGSLQVVELKASEKGEEGGRTVEKADEGGRAQGESAAGGSESAPPAEKAGQKAAERKAAADKKAAEAGASSGAKDGAGGASAAGAARSDAEVRRAERMFKLNLRNAESQDPVAQLEVGKAYLEGRGVEQDAEQARVWLEQAAQQGVNAATERLAELALAK